MHEQIRDFRKQKITIKKTQMETREMKKKKKSKMKNVFNKFNIKLDIAGNRSINLKTK